MAGTDPASGFVEKDAMMGDKIDARMGDITMGDAGKIHARMGDITKGGTGKEMKDHPSYESSAEASFESKVSSWSKELNLWKSFKIMQRHCLHNLSEPDFLIDTQLFKLGRNLRKFYHLLLIRTISSLMQRQRR